MRALSRRDLRGPSDQVKLLIDSYNDRRSGFEFAVNPDGVKRDFSMSNDGNEDSRWNGIWDVATDVDSLGWTAEFRIPLSQLRYPARRRAHVRLRRLARHRAYRERTAGRSTPAANRTLVAARPPRGAVGAQHGPPDRGHSIRRREERAAPHAHRRLRPRAGADRGGDLKVGITPNVTLDATINPDFGQVESDPSVVNLTAFETFLVRAPAVLRRRTGLYRFELNCYIVVDCSTNEGLFYSRRIGRFPSLRDLYGDETTPTSTTIAAATKLTGRTKGGLAIGVLMSSRVK